MPCGVNTWTRYIPETTSPGKTCICMSVSHSLWLLPSRTDAPGSRGNLLTPTGSFCLGDATRRARTMKSSNDTAQTNFDCRRAEKSVGKADSRCTDEIDAADALPAAYSVCSCDAWIVDSIVYRLRGAVNGRTIIKGQEDTPTTRLRYMVLLLGSGGGRIRQQGLPGPTFSPRSSA